MTADAVPESMITWSGTRHVVAEMRPTEYGNDHLLIGVCNARYRSLGSWQHGLRAHKRDCKRCFPPAEDFGSDTLTDLERARTVAVELEQQCALLARQVADGRQLVIELHRNGVLSDPEAAVLFGTLRGVPSPVADEVQP